MSQSASTKLKGKAIFGLDRDAPWVEKYRPQSLDDVAAHKEIVDTSGYQAPPSGEAEAADA